MQWARKLIRADEIIENKADCILALKGDKNQLFEEVKDEFKCTKNTETDINVDYGLGWIATRKCSVVFDFQFITNDNNKWNKLNQIIKIECLRGFKKNELS